jgi:hypothetical protein
MYGAWDTLKNIDGANIQIIDWGGLHLSLENVSRVVYWGTSS